MGSPEMPYWGSSVPSRVFGLQTHSRSRRAAPEVGELMNNFVRRTGQQAMIDIF